MKNLYLIIGLFVAATNMFAQVAINTDGTAPDNSAMLDVKSTTKGLLAPRMTIAQRNAIVSPATGLLVFCTDNNQYYSNHGTPASPEWTMLTSPWAASGSNIYYNSGNVGIGTTNPARKLEVYGITGIRGGGYLAVDAISAGDNFGYISSGGMSTGTGLKFETARPQDAVGVVRMTISNEGNVGIGWTSPHAPLQLSNILMNRKIILYEGDNNDHQYYGFGINGNILRYQVNTTSDRHVFFAGVNATSSVELMSIRGDGAVAIGTSSVPGSSILTVTSSNKGFLPPRMSTQQMNAIPSPVEGLVVYNTTVKSLFFFDGISWVMSANRDGHSCGEFLYGNKTYHTVIIGTQCWMKENLDIGVMVTTPGSQTNNGIIEKYCYNNDEWNCWIWGGLYQWKELMQYATTEGIQGICPPGWHLPTDEEWCKLETYLDATVICLETFGRGTDAGGKMKEAGNNHWYTPNTGATNSSGFTALGAGAYNPTLDIFWKLYGETEFWSSTIYDVNHCWIRSIVNSSSGIDRYGQFVNDGLSVRCLKD